MREFDLIQKYFVPLSMGNKACESFQNDAAILDIPDGYELVITSDSLNSGVHFFENQNPESIARKALRTNLSDLSSMGAKPFCYQLCIGMPNIDEQWVEKFSGALLEEQKLYDVFCSGGDTTSTQFGITISITALGLVQKGKAIKRSGAREGDFVVLTRFVGDAFCGLQSLRGQMSNVPESCVDLYYAPQPPVALAVVLHEYVHAGLDISDGLIADLHHMIKASGVSASVNLPSIGFSAAVSRLLEEGSVSHQDLLTGGDDYQLLLAVPPNKYEAFKSKALNFGVNIQNIGEFTQGDGSVFVADENGGNIQFEKIGWQHF